MANIVPYSSPGIAATSRWRSLSSVAGGYAVIGGTITLIGWALNVRRLTDWNNDGISMFANAAACAVLSGLALLALNGPAWPRRQFAIRVAGCCVAVLGGLTLLQHVSGYNLEIDQLLANRPWGQRAATSPMRMGPPASTSFLILGAGLLLATSNSRARRLASNLAILPIAISSLS